MSLNAAAHRPGRDLDWVLALVAATVGCVALGLVWRGRAVEAPRPEAPALATLDEASGEVRRRPQGTLVWEELGPGARLWEGDALFVPPQSAASVLFDDGTRLRLDQNTLVALEPTATAGDAPTVRLERGQVVGRSGQGGLALVTRQGTAVLQGGAEARLQRSRGGPEQVAVLKGSALLGAQSMGPQDFAVAGAGGWTRGRHPVALVSPAPLWRAYFSGDAPPAVTLSWKGRLPPGAQLVVLSAEDEAAEALFRLKPGAAQTADFTPAGEGRFAWRLVDARGAALSELRRFDLLRDVPPRAVSPRSAEKVEGYLDQKVPFAWTQVPGVGTYELEVAAAADFDRIVLRREVRGTGLRLAWTQREGHYHWRVRAREAERGESPWSKPASFRYLDRPLLDAPELIDTQLELELEPGP